MKKAIIINPKYSTVGDTVYIHVEYGNWLLCAWSEWIHDGGLEPFVLNVKDVRVIEEE